MSIPLITQSHIEVDVDFYDAAEALKLQAAPYDPKKVAAVAGHTIRIETAEFLAYYLFYRKKVGTNYINFSGISQKLHVALDDLDGCVVFNGKSISRHPGARHQISSVSEHVGEAIGIAVVSRIHGLINADWEPIPTSPGKNGQPSFDFQIASDLSTLIQVESKGSSVANNQRKSPAISIHKSSIDRKKTKLRALPAGVQDRYPAGVRYGTIAALDADQAHNAKCWLVDPPTEPTEMTPKIFRLLRRQEFLRDWIGFISPRSQLAAALQTRVADIKNLNDPFEIDGVKLRRGSGEPFDYGPHGNAQSIAYFFGSKSHTSNYAAGGVVLQVSDEALMFLGIRSELLSLASLQDFSRISDYSFGAGTETQFIECVLSKTKYEALVLPPSVISSAKEANGNMSFRLKGSIQYAKSGLVFGVLPLG